jgi:mycofactocin system glycosyltransferase
VNTRPAQQGGAAVNGGGASKGADPGVAAAGRLPEGFRVALDPGVRWTGDGSSLVGGSPIRLLRLTPAGRRLVDRLVAGEPVPPSAAAQKLTRRLLDAGLAHPRPPGPAAPTAVATVIPVRNDPEGVAATLAALAADRRAADESAHTAPGSTVVVDDLSSEPEPVAAACRRGRATLIRRTAWGGPGAARNDGWRATDEPLVAFLDANCEPEPDWLDEILPHFADPQVAAVAPRIVPAVEPTAPGWLAAYEAVSSPLDLGAREAIVRPRSPVAYVPTAALVVRRAALEGLGGFDETLPVGEDVDFVWRLVAAGWTVRYEPRAVVHHPMRRGWQAWLRQRYRYGTSAAPLARRHGRAVAPAVVSPWTAAAWALVAAGQPVLGAVAAGSSVAALATRLPRRNTGHRAATATGGEDDRDTGGRAEPGVRSIPLVEAVRLAGVGHGRGGLALARAVRRAWAPVAVLLAVTSRRSRPALAAVVVVPGLLDWVERRPRLDPARFVALGLADDLAYAAGVWAGCARERSGRSLEPDLRSASRHPVRHTYEPLSGTIGGRG